MGTWIILALIVAGAAGFAAWKHKDKLRAILDRKDEAMLSAPDVRPVEPRPRLAGTPVKSFEEMTREDWDAYRETFVPSTRVYLPTWEQKLARDKQIRDTAAMGAGPDRADFDMNELNGFLAHPPTENGKPYAFTYPPKPGWAIRVMPYSGSQIKVVNAKEITSTYAIIENPPTDGVIVLEVRFVGERYAVQYAPR